MLLFYCLRRFPVLRLLTDDSRFLAVRTRRGLRLFDMLISMMFQPGHSGWGVGGVCVCVCALWSAVCCVRAKTHTRHSTCTHTHRRLDVASLFAFSSLSSLLAACTSSSVLSCPISLFSLFPPRTRFIFALSLARALSSRSLSFASLVSVCVCGAGVGMEVCVGESRDGWRKTGDGRRERTRDLTDMTFFLWRLNAPNTSQSCFPYIALCCCHPCVIVCVVVDVSRSLSWSPS